jgi:hypothetical protein
MPHSTDEARRRFLAYFSAIGLSSTLLPGALWAQAQQADAAAPQFTIEMLKNALALSGLTFSDDDEKAMRKFAPSRFPTMSLRRFTSAPSHRA